MDVADLVYTTRMNCTHDFVPGMSAVGQLQTVLVTCENVRFGPESRRQVQWIMPSQTWHASGGMPIAASAAAGQAQRAVRRGDTW